MRFQRQKSHMIDFLFPIALFFVFALSSIAVILFATNIYRSSTEHSALNYTAGTSLSYIAEKIHQNDENGGVTLGKFDGIDALILEHTYEENTYYTYIYEYQGKLKELFVKEGVEATASVGRSIIDVASFSMTQIDKNMYKFTCVDDNNQISSTIITSKTTNTDETNY